jgi:predicted anti-sigma-YlaC factor YlaD
MGEFQMEHKKLKELISLYIDGELDKDQKEKVEEHLKGCDECRKEFEEMSKFEEVMSKMELKEPPKETWQIYSNSVYNRLERRFGWILFSIGAMILLFFGGYKMVESIIKDTSTSLLLKIGILTVLGGVVVLLVSMIRERCFVRKRERYKEVIK